MAGVDAGIRLSKTIRKMQKMTQPPCKCECEFGVVGSLDLGTYFCTLRIYNSPVCRPDLVISSQSSLPMQKAWNCKFQLKFSTVTYCTHVLMSFGNLAAQTFESPDILLQFRPLPCILKLS